MTFTFVVNLENLIDTNIVQSNIHRQKFVFERFQRNEFL